MLLGKMQSYRLLETGGIYSYHWTLKGQIWPSDTVVFCGALSDDRRYFLLRDNFELKIIGKC
jgi:hypothetical protein